MTLNFRLSNIKTQTERTSSYNDLHSLPLRRLLFDWPPYIGEKPEVMGGVYESSTQAPTVEVGGALTESKWFQPVPTDSSGVGGRS